MLSFLKPFLIDKTLALNLSWLIAWVLQLPIRKVYKLEWVFFFIRPYSSRGIGIWSYVTELHIKRAKRVVKKTECFFQIENLRTLFNLWLTDIFFKKGSWCNRQQLGCQVITLLHADNCSFAFEWWIWMHIQIHV